MASPMYRVSLRSILAHKLRLLLTVLTVMLGTAFIAGSFMFTSSLSSTFDAALDNAFSGVDVAAQGEFIDASTRQALLHEQGVSGVNVADKHDVVVADSSAKPFQTRGNASRVIPYYPAEQSVAPASELKAGRRPHGSSEVLVTEDAVERFGISVGDKLVVVNFDKRDELTVTGVVKPLFSYGGIIILMDADAFISRYGDPRALAIGAKPGVDSDALISRLETGYPDMKFQPGEELSKEISAEVSAALKFVNYFLVAFGLIALLVGTFIIANTFAMIVAQRTKEFALLRALGASRRQIVLSVVVEATVVGVIGSIIGVLAGIGLVAVIKFLLGTQGFDMGSSWGLGPGSVLAPIAIGVMVTIASAWAPARRAGKTKPVEAMRSVETAAGYPLKKRTIVGICASLVGIFAALVAVFGDFETQPGAILVGVSAVLLIVGFFLSAPALSLPVVTVLGKVAGAPFGAPGKMAATNSQRNPRRTAATAFALTLGVALVTAIGMLGVTMKASLAETIESKMYADFILAGPSDGSVPIPRQTLDAVENVDGVEESIIFATAPVSVDGQIAFNYGPKIRGTNVTNANLTHLGDFEMIEGTASFADGFIATKEFAAAHKWQVGKSYPLTMENKSLGEVELKGIFVTNNIFRNMVVISPKIPQKSEEVAAVAILGEGESLRRDLEEAVADQVIVQVMSSREYSNEAAKVVNQMLAVLYGLLSLSVIIAILGIINTLSLGVNERRKEIGMLRAVGIHRRQIKVMITLEAVQIAIFGAIAGLGIGMGLGWAFIDVLETTGLDTVVVPWGLISSMLVGSGVVGVVAAIWPSAHAAKTPPLEAISA